MRNPLNRRLKRDFKGELGKYFVIFVFVCGMIAIVSGFLVANNSMVSAYNEGFTKYNIEDGNFELALEANDKLIEELEKEDLTIYKNFYKEEETNINDSKLRIFKPRTDVNGVCLMSGEMPVSSDEIAIDRMYADNNELAVGDTIEVKGKALNISGLVALSDYSALYSSPLDMMFDASKFGVAIMTEEGFNSFDEAHLHYSYSWVYGTEPKNEEEAKTMSEDFLEVLAVKSAASMNAVTNYIPEYINQAIIFTGDDISRDNTLFTMFLYIIMVIIAFVFAIMTSNTITKEANVIGTLRASGYSRGELVRHYMAMPVIVILAAAIIGNVLGYTLLKDYMANMYYSSYSLPTYVTLWNADALIKTTVVPLVLLIAINFIVLQRKLSLSPLKFIRRDLSRRQKKKAFRLNTKIGIMHRFRLRIIFQNIPNYITIIIGIFLANVILLFGFALNPLLEHYQDDITSNMICDYQYVLKTQAQTKTQGAEKYCAETLETTDESIKIEGVTVYGIEEGSSYVDLDLNGGIYISNAFSEKYRLSEGDSVTLKEKYSADTFTFKISGVYHYPSEISIFMDKAAFNEKFGNDKEYFNGYFSNEKITDIDERAIAAVVTQDDMTKASRQMILSMGDVMTLFVGFGVIMFVLIIFLLSKIIIEKNSQSISMTKILGYTGGEISRLYVLSTAIVVIASLIVTIPLCSVIIGELFRMVFASYSGWLPYYVPMEVYVQMAGMGIGAYAVIAALQYLKISRIPKSNALKNAE